MSRSAALICASIFLLTVGINGLAQERSVDTVLRFEEISVSVFTNSADTSMGFWVSGFRDDNAERLLIDSHQFLPEGRFVGMVKEATTNGSSRRPGIDSALVLIGEYIIGSTGWAYPRAKTIAVLVALNEDFSIPYNAGMGKSIWIIAWGTTYTGSLYRVVQ